MAIHLHSPVSQPLRPAKLIRLYHLVRSPPVRRTKQQKGLFVHFILFQASQSAPFNQASPLAQLLWPFQPTPSDQIDLIVQFCWGQSADWLLCSPRILLFSPANSFNPSSGNLPVPSPSHGQLLPHHRAGKVVLSKIVARQAMIFQHQHTEICYEVFNSNNVNVMPGTFISCSDRVWLGKLVMVRCSIIRPQGLVPSNS